MPGSGVPVGLGSPLVLRLGPLTAHELSLIRSLPAHSRAFLVRQPDASVVVRLDLSEVKELVSLLRRCSNNLNQIAKRVNETGRLYEADVEGLREQLDGVWEGARKILALLSKLE